MKTLLQQLQTVCPENCNVRISKMRQLGCNNMHLVSIKYPENTDLNIETIGQLHYDKLSPLLKSAGEFRVIYYNGTKFIFYSPFHNTFRMFCDGMDHYDEYQDRQSVRCSGKCHNLKKLFSYLLTNQAVLF